MEEHPHEQPHGDHLDDEEVDEDGDDVFDIQECEKQEEDELDQGSDGASQGDDGHPHELLVARKAVAGSGGLPNKKGPVEHEGDQNGEADTSHNTLVHETDGRLFAASRLGIDDDDDNEEDVDEEVD